MEPSIRSMPLIVSISCYWLQDSASGAGVWMDYSESVPPVELPCLRIALHCVCSSRPGTKKAQGSLSLDFSAKKDPWH